MKLFFFTWAALVALFGLGGYLLYEDEYQRQLQDHLMNKGLTSATEGRWEEAIASYTAVLDKDREHTVALTNRGMAYSKTGQDTEAMLDFTASLAAASDAGMALASTQALIASPVLHERHMPLT